MKARLLTVLCILTASLLLGACGPSNTIRLLQPRVDTGVLAAPTAATVAVVEFQDKRPDTHSLGLRRDKSYFTSNDSPRVWAGRAAAESLKAKGYRVTYATSAAEAAKGTPDYILTGSLERLELKESFTTLEGEIRIHYLLSNKERKLWTETLSASRSTTNLPSGSIGDDMLRNLLGDVTQTMTQKASGHIN